MILASIWLNWRYDWISNILSLFSKYEKVDVNSSMALSNEVIRPNNIVMYNNKAEIAKLLLFRELILLNKKINLFFLTKYFVGNGSFPTVICWFGLIIFLLE